MALIEVYHVVADQYPVDPSWTSPDTLEGKIVSINSSGYVVPCDGSAAAPIHGAGASYPFGLAGDTQSDSTASTPYTSSVVISGNAYVNPTTGEYNGQFGSTVNRVSDFYNETRASGLMTVYHSGGKFKTDQIVDPTDLSDWSGTVPGAPLFATSTGLITPDTSNSTIVVGRFISIGEEQSGVPGTVARSSTSLGTYVTFKLTI